MDKHNVCSLGIPVNVSTSKRGGFMFRLGLVPDSPPSPGCASKSNKKQPATSTNLDTHAGMPKLNREMAGADMVDEEEEEYDENEDEDFAEEEEDDDSASSDDEDIPAGQPAPKPKKRKPEADLIELDSGDEATIKERKPKKRRKQKEAEVDDEASGAEGGFVRTRAQRLADKVEKKERRRNTGDATIDVDQVWADLSSIPVGRVTAQPAASDDHDVDMDGDGDKENNPAQDPGELVTIRERIEYAGKVEEVERQVLRGSREAQKYFAEHPEADPDHQLHDPDPQALQKPLKRPSMFEPNPTSSVKGVPPEKLRPGAPNRMDVLMAQKRADEKKGAVKMSTVQKSALDWRGFVDKEGITEELAAYGKSNLGYLAREDFLGRAAMTREQAARDARLKS